MGPVRASLASLVLAACSFGGHDSVVSDADPTRPDADPTAPDADPAAPDADPARPDAMTTPDAEPRVYLFADGFEGGLGPWTDVTLESGDSATASSAQAHTGGMSGRGAVNSTPEAQAAFYKDLSPMMEVHARFHVRLDAGFSNSSYVGLLSFVNHASGWNNIATATMGSNQRLYMENNAGGGSIPGTASVALVPGQWHQLDMSATISPTAGSLTLLVDGQVQVQVSGIDTGSLPVNRLAFGIIWEGQGSQSNALHVDDVIIDPLPL
jgi:hypothetical protein